MTLRRRGAIAAVALIAVAIGVPQTATAQYRTLRVDGIRADSLTRLGFDVVAVEPSGVLVVASPRDRTRLEALGLRFAELSRRPSLASAAAAPVIYRPYDDPVRGIRSWVDSLTRSNSRVHVDTIGRSYEGRPIFALKVGQAGDSPQRPNVIFIATYHAREWAATEMALRLVRFLAAPPGTDARRDSLAQSRDIWVIPVANPDGYQYTFTNERLWRKTRSPQANGNIGVDMNRNHTVSWGLDNQGSSGEAASEIFRGTSPASEVETRSIESFLAAHPPVAAVSYHTFAGLIIYPPGSVYGALPADWPVYKALAGTHLKSAVSDRLPGSSRVEYAPGPGWNLYTTNGEFTEFAATRFGALTFTPELSSGYGLQGFYGFEFPDDDVQLDRLFQDNLPFALDLLDAARDPVNFRNAARGNGVDRLTLESVSPEIRATLPASEAPGASISAGSAFTFRIDSAAGGKFTRRVISRVASRPSTFSITAGGRTASFRLLTISGAEPGDPAWTARSFSRDSVFVRNGTRSWFGTGGTLTTVPVTVPVESDTVSLVFWTLYLGNGFSPYPSGQVDASTDGGNSWTPVLVVRGSA
ncbi:MAG: M14 family zinc carboxypeptidase, partial [Gemmatimonadota bacterium]|nr:M14 family zinc carboxypeptidase [Gemmatimonadota bacterium]